MIYAIILMNLLGNTVGAALQSLVSGAASGSEQGQTLGAVSGLNNLMAVIAPALATPLLSTVSHLPRGDWRIGAPMFFCAALLAAALLMAVLHFRAQRHAAPPSTPTPA
jgi:DHA1 family tetracycline resistance protein-like MFS transporter